MICKLWVPFIKVQNCVHGCKRKLGSSFHYGFLELSGSKFCRVVLRCLKQFLIIISSYVQWLTDRHKRALYEALEKVKTGIQKLLCSWFCILEEKKKTWLGSLIDTYCYVQSWWFSVSSPFSSYSVSITLLKSVCLTMLLIPCCLVLWLKKKVIKKRKIIADFYGMSVEFLLAVTRVLARRYFASKFTLFFWHCRSSQYCSWYVFSETNFTIMNREKKFH